MSIVDVDPYLAMQWERWLERRSSSARDHLIVSYAPLVKFVAGRVGAGLPTSVDPGDLVSSGVLGLIDAIERFDPQRGVKFETFATPRIRGAIYDGLRELDWVPRSVRSRAREVRAGDGRLRGARRAVRRTTTSWPTTCGSPGRSSTSGCRRSHRRRSGRWNGPSTPAPSRAALSGEVPIVPSAVVEEQEVRDLMRAEIDKLPDREKLVLSLYYDEGLTLAQISRVLGREREPGARSSTRSRCSTCGLA